ARPRRRACRVVRSRLSSDRRGARPRARHRGGDFAVSDAPRVTVARGGLSGIAAALRLAQRGYRVKLYEQQPELGGNLASRPSPGGVALDVYPHMFLSWYH